MAAKLEGPWKSLTLLPAVPYGALLSTPYTYTLYPTGAIYPNWISTNWTNWINAFCTKTNQICYKIRDNCITVHKVNCAKISTDCNNINKRCNALLISNKAKIPFKRHLKPKTRISLKTTPYIITKNLKNEILTNINPLVPAY